MIRGKDGTQVGFNDVMNAIWEDASLGYQERVPELVDDNFKEWATGVLNPANFNEWADALMNRIGLSVMRNYAWANPMQSLRKGVLEYGEQIQEIYIGLIQGQQWQPKTSAADAGKIFKSEIPETVAVYHRINREVVYEASFNRVALKKAFVTADALERYILTIWERLYTSDELDEYLLMKELIKLNAEKGLLRPITMKPQANGKIDYTDLIEKVKTVAGDFRFISTKYNAMGVAQHCPLDKQVILITNALNAAIDVNVLAQAFNLDKAEFLSRRIVLDDLGVEGALLAVISEDWYMVYDSLREMRALDNPQSLENKYFYHVHQVVSTSRLENAVLFTTDEYVPAETVELVGGDAGITAVRGQYIDLVPEVKSAAGTTADVNQAVIYQLAGNKPNTKVDINTNRLYVDLQEADTFSIRVIALYDTTVFKDYVVTVTDVTAEGRTANVITQEAYDAMQKELAAAHALNEKLQKEKSADQTEEAKK